MHACMYRGHLSWKCPWDRAFQLGQGEGPIGLMGPISQPRSTNDTALLMLGHTCALVCVFWPNFTLGSYGCPVSSCRRYSDTPGPWKYACMFHWWCRLHYTYHCNDWFDLNVLSLRKLQSSKTMRRVMHNWESMRTAISEIMTRKLLHCSDDLVVWLIKRSTSGMKWSKYAACLPKKCVVSKN